MVNGFVNGLPTALFILYLQHSLRGGCCDQVTVYIYIFFGRYSRENPIIETIIAIQKTPNMVFIDGTFCCRIRLCFTH